MTTTINWTDPWTIGWVIWLLLFVIWEGIALFNSKKGDTLSEHIWIWFGTRKGQPKSGTIQLRRFILLAFMVWLGAHFLTGGWV